MVDVIPCKVCRISEQGRAARANLKHVRVGFEKKYCGGVRYYPCQQPKGKRSRHMLSALDQQ